MKVPWEQQTMELFQVQRVYKSTACDLRVSMDINLSANGPSETLYH
jgi:hypothetical protein